MRILLLATKGQYLDLIRSGRKTATVRIRNVAQPEQTIAFTNYRSTVYATCTDVVPRTIDTLTNADADADGFEDVHALRAALLEHYPTLTPDDRVWVIRFAAHSGKIAASSS